MKMREGGWAGPEGKRGQDEQKQRGLRQHQVWWEPEEYLDGQCPTCKLRTWIWKIQAVAKQEWLHI